MFDFVFSNTPASQHSGTQLEAPWRPHCNPWMSRHQLSIVKCQQSKSCSMCGQGSGSCGAWYTRAREPAAWPQETGQKQRFTQEGRPGDCNGRSYDFSWPESQVWCSRRVLSQMIACTWRWKQCTLFRYPVKPVQKQHSQIKKKSTSSGESNQHLCKFS